MLKPKIHKHYDKRNIEFAVQVDKPDGSHELHYPTNCGFASDYRFPPDFERVEDQHHPHFDFELWCWNRFGDRHREIKPLPYLAADLEALAEICRNQ